MSFINKDQMAANEYIEKTRQYLDYLEEHIENIRLAFQEVSEACDGMAWVGDDCTWHNFRQEVCYHDISKFSEEEFAAYRAKFYPVKNTPELYDCFAPAWDNHKEENTHHWESIRYDKNMPGVTETDIVHMIIDWTAMGYKFGDTAQEYYEANKNKIIIHEEFIQFMYEIFERIEKQ